MIDQKTIEHIAKLAKLKINPSETEEYGRQLSKVLNHFEQIAKIDTTGIEPLVTPTDIDFFAREDLVANDYTAEQMVSNAPEKAGQLFKVPPVV
ncbi:MAG: glutamyl-tRNA amidotransferase [Bdellovibrionales bacterium RIFCSPHIGHO2_01_FULL_40_29]|nr:MAG: glutamyl-tRNA amidotransferase [Bdellovibrionales bacterium RIFCSPHIGHO2_01_FULL_40_29]OFZ33159.1 MAG: glutamyl-tRNA amidotransferase [Bdellovibrionales bacterium RIFCSPHIGHO2_02_FULL_40_15]